MALVLGDNFSYGGSKPLDARLKYNTLADMKAVADATMYDGCMAYCVAADKTYQWKSTNTVDESTGKWREFTSGGGGTDYTAGDGIDITDDTISIDPMPAEDMSEVISPLPSIQPRYHKYSTEEHIVGEWIDGRNIYERTYQLATPITLTANAWNDINSVDIAGVEKLIDAKFYYATSTMVNLRIVGTSTKLYVYNQGDAISNVNIITLQYIKSE